MRIRIPIPGGTLKLKNYRYLRSYERDRKVPVLKLGWVYVVWEPKSVKDRVNR